MHIPEIDNKVFAIGLGCLVMLIGLTLGKPVSYVFIGVAVLITAVKIMSVFFK